MSSPVDHEDGSAMYLLNVFQLSTNAQRHTSENRTFQDIRKKKEGKKGRKNNRKKKE
jgi:hypothetical protein